MGKKNISVVCHEEELTVNQIEKLFNEFSLRFSNIWLENQMLEKDDYNYVVTKARKEN
ncbi:hypothetical protein [Roseburia sp. MSJ-14]|uniref:hypothetical protein n=1 Tax=Roseburia sp. MSJ-14 TaxID=2841514 RepID=UPI001C10FD09|nr:hypothetical protein [Roseburia sp. MSJ-14]MBU5473571.1 hypothetical protein [Roseburia sp. MSJ-14]